jgi:hypothetical protein
MRRGEHSADLRFFMADNATAQAVENETQNGNPEADNVYAAVLRRRVGKGGQGVADAMRRQPAVPTSGAARGHGGLASYRKLDASAAFAHPKLAKPEPNRQ